MDVNTTDRPVFDRIRQDKLEKRLFPKHYMRKSQYHDTEGSSLGQQKANSIIKELFDFEQNCSKKQHN